MRNRQTPILALMFLMLYFTFSIAAPAYAVIPQLIGPLSALAGVIMPILGFILAAIVTSLVFARDAVKMIFFRFTEFVSRHKAVVSVVVVVIVAGFAWLIYQASRPIPTSTKTTYATVTTGTQSANTSKSPQTGQRVSWSTFRGGVSRTGHLDELPGPTTGNLIWKFEEPGAVAVDFSSSPAVVGDRLYIGSAQGSIFSSGGVVYCIDAHTGEPIWRYRSPIQIFSSPIVVGGRVYVGEGFHQDIDCHLRCLDANSGEELWSFPTASHVESTPTVSQGKVYFGAGGDGVYCVDVLEGQKIWHYPAVHVDISPLVWKGKAYFGTGYGEYRIYALDTNTGKEVWSKRVDYPVWGSPTAHEDTVFFGIGNGNFTESAENPKGKVLAVNAETGGVIWTYQPKDSVLTAVAYQNGFIYFGSRDGHVYALNAADGKLHWKSRVGNPIVSSPAITEQMAYVGGNNGAVYGIDLSTGDLKWRFDTNTIAGGLQIFSSPAVANRRVYIGSTDRYIFCLGETDGTVPLEDR
jgi:eukaryotic-like serine/threonine-protein kinase